ncbi:ribose-phosphate pyrophosphokinase-like protein [Amylocarpus encephaloides]|uniref:Ribose-phosphate pyrophosphokinase-like protein n=1 Tax=Amylocarpus encephaloides TaxID=45428 RepID=A0A9P8C2H7_9HELO|nr:ribose-phosphate pyrophosphokinase-like protein [Amylocarpus encephaloides]
MVRNIVVLGGNSHPELVKQVSDTLGVPACNRILNKFSVGESRLEIQDSVRGKDVYIIQSGGGKVNDNFVDLCIMISACKTGSAKRVTAVLPLFPYSRQPDVPYNKAGAPLSKAPTDVNRNDFTFESRPPTPSPSQAQSVSLPNGQEFLQKKLGKTLLDQQNGHSYSNSITPRRSDTTDSVPLSTNGHTRDQNGSSSSLNGSTVGNQTFTTHDYENYTIMNNSLFNPKPGYKQWVAQAGTLVADLLTCAGADHIITMDLHDPQYQGFFDIPVDNLYGKSILKRYIQTNIPDFKSAVIVSPDAGGAKRATVIADDLNVEFALIHKERRPTRITDRQNATMMLVGNVANRVCILVDDLADTSNTITRAAKLLKNEGATHVYALLTHGIFSGDAIARINASALDRVVVTNSVPQDEHVRLCPKLEVLEVGSVFAEAIRRVHHGESISALFWD